MTGLTYLFSIIAVLAVIRWFIKVEKSADPKSAMHDGLLGLKETPASQLKARARSIPPWDRRSADMS